MGDDVNPLSFLQHEGEGGVKELSLEERMRRIEFVVTVLGTEYRSHVKNCDRRASENMWLLRGALLLLVTCLGILIKAQFHLG